MEKQKKSIEQEKDFANFSLPKYLYGRYHGNHPPPPAEFDDVEDPASDEPSMSWRGLLYRLEKYFQNNGIDRLCNMSDLKNMGIGDNQFNVLRNLTDECGEDEFIAILLALLLTLPDDDSRWSTVRQALLNNKSNLPEEGWVIQKVKARVKYFICSELGYPCDHPLFSEGFSRMQQWR